MYHRNENISGVKFVTCSFLFMIAKNWKKMFDVVYKHHVVVCISIFNVAYKFKISRPKYLFLRCLFLTIKRVQKGVYTNDCFFTVRLY